MRVCLEYIELAVMFALASVAVGVVVLVKFVKWAFTRKPLMNKIITAAILALAVTAHAADYYVGDVPALSNALAAASSGDTVWCSNATYAAVSLTVPDGVIVRGIGNIPGDVAFYGPGAYTYGGRTVTMGIGSWLIGIAVYDGSPALFEGGGNVYGGSLSNCYVSGGYVEQGTGGGVCNAILYGCTVTANTAHGNADGGGVADIICYNCEIYGNEISQTSVGGGVSGGTLYNCLIRNNAVGYDANFGGAAYATLYNCTVTANDDVGMAYCTATNTISYGNGAADEGCSYSYSTTNDPFFVGGGNYRLQAGSPCIGTGTNGAWTATTRDLDGNKRIWPNGGTVDMGCYEYGSQAEYTVPYLLILGTDKNAVAGTWGAVHGRRVED